MKNILIVTQKVDRNDSVLGFFHEWIREFSKKSNKVTVICLFEGKHSLPENVKVLSLGKDKGVSKFTYFLRLYKYVWQERKNYEMVFVHMNQIYVVLCGLFWRLFNKKVAFWYAHGSVSFSLRIAEKFTNIIFTSTKDGFRLFSKKIFVVGQGIDVELFKPNIESQDDFKIISVGRISVVKRFDLIIEAVGLLRDRGVFVKLDIVGGAETDDQKANLKFLVNLVKEKKLDDRVIFCGEIYQDKLPYFLQKSSLFVNASENGSLDKTGLEAMSVGLPVVTCNESYFSVFGNDASALMFKKGDPLELSDKIQHFLNMNASEKKLLSHRMREVVVNNHTLSSLISKILSILCL
jgi:glycosyltransferase involved in cell wall biosynthesis